MEKQFDKSQKALALIFHSVYSFLDVYLTPEDFWNDTNLEIFYKSKVILLIRLFEHSRANFMEDDNEVD